MRENIYTQFCSVYCLKAALILVKDCGDHTASYEVAKTSQEND